mmetsp:Transcript_71726/g.214129  ORF Transcript_71726/g.214129 Transcript_71726/m.214129 type:complete len:217 (-) Transcript_71726:67-717(-)
MGALVELLLPQRAAVTRDHAVEVVYAADDPSFAAGSLLHKRHNLVQPTSSHGLDVKLHQVYGFVAPERCSASIEHLDELRARRSGIRNFAPNARILHEHLPVAGVLPQLRRHALQHSVHSLPSTASRTVRTTLGVVEDQIHRKRSAPAGLRDGGRQQGLRQAVQLLGPEGSHNSKGAGILRTPTASTHRRQRTYSRHPEQDENKGFQPMLADTQTS